MRLKSIVLVLLVLIILSLSGCTKDQTNKENGNNGTSYPIKNNATLKNGGENMTAGFVEIYQISRETFCDSLENNACYNFKSINSKCYKYSENGGNYQTLAVTLFKVEKEFVDFFSNKTLLQEFLAQNQVNINVEDVLIFEAPHTPLSAWIKTTTEDLFLTINEKPEDVGYVYRIYNSSEYYRKYGMKYAKLTFNGKDISNNKTIYMYYDYADLPLLTVCTAQGAKAKWVDEANAIIKFNEDIYELDALNNSICKKHTNVNLFNSVSGGSPYYKYLSNGDFYVDSNLLEYVLYEMGKKVNIYCALDKNTVEIFLGQDMG